MQNKLRQIITLTVHTPGKQQLYAVSTVCIFPIRAYLFAVHANAEYQYAIKTGLVPSLSVTINF